MIVQIPEHGLKSLDELRPEVRDVDRPVDVGVHLRHPVRGDGVDVVVDGRAEDTMQLLRDGLSMVYSFYDPEETERSLGTLMILDHIERARRLSLPHVYLGYWVEGSRKMAYKARFLPQERLGMQGWERAE